MADSGPEPTGNSPDLGPRSPQPPADFERFVQEHYQAAYRFAFSLTGNHNDACDITQQSFYLAYTRSHQLRDASKRKQWLFTILHREFLHSHRQTTAHPQVSLEFSEPVLPHVHVDYTSSLDSKAMLDVLRSLDDAFRMPLVLFYLKQFSYKEIAATLELPIGTVMSRLARGKQMLRARLEGSVETSRMSFPLEQPGVEGQTSG